MEKYHFALLTTLALFATAVSPISAIAAGRSASSIPNTILNGKGVPANNVGINGDFYIDTRSLLLYGPKKNGKWPAPQNLQGPTGATGASGNDGKNGSDGKNGTDGKTVTNASTVAGASGPTGPQGEKGATGPAGPAGPTGPAGPQGATGASGSGSGTPGPQGATGATGATGPAGPTGATGSAGATGAPGPQGDAGPTGATGATGPAGAIKVIQGNLTFGDLSGVSGTSQAVSINGFKANKSYLLHVKVFTYQPNDPGENFMWTSMSASGINGSPTVATQYLLSHGYSYRTGTGRYENSIDINITLDGGTVATDYGVTMTFVVGRNTSGTMLTKLEGSYIAEEVQTVSSTF